MSLLDIGNRVRWEVKQWDSTPPLPDSDLGWKSGTVVRHFKKNDRDYLVIAADEGGKISISLDFAKETLQSEEAQGENAKFWSRLLLELWDQVWEAKYRGDFAARDEYVKQMAMVRARMKSEQQGKYS